MIGVDDPAGVAANIARAVSPAERRDPGARRRALGALALAIVIGSAVLVVAILEVALTALGLAPAIDVALGLIVVWLAVTLGSGWLTRS
ncbi:MAG: hypothetical protein ABSB36_00045 [Candidatus Dormibacteria bacterium]